MSCREHWKFEEYGQTLLGIAQNTSSGTILPIAPRLSVGDVGVTPAKREITKSTAMRTVFLVSLLVLSSHLQASVQDFLEYDVLETADMLAKVDVWSTVGLSRIRRSKEETPRRNCGVRFIIFVREVCGERHCFRTKGSLERIAHLCCTEGCSPKYLRENACCRERRDVFFR
ncbi:hypothetical protein QR680_008361 [Steinernema hermaphroditum]|uniref:Insulin-like domain-containing protein n=1 Tax=Steinernema hermaphroditum TaxID=289476 RepID=A0AA39M7I3_9BILA|nr:hypothetical protein QR680_008361 [Steinernema hermaphroditum]